MPKPGFNFNGEDAVKRIWARDESLWVSASKGAGGDWLGWLDLPHSLSNGHGTATQPHREILGTFSNFIVLGMGGSSLTVEVLRSLFGHDVNVAEGAPRLKVLDTVNPRQIAAVLGDIDSSDSVFALASKSGTTVEPLSLEAVFRQDLEHQRANNDAHRFIVISDDGTPASRRAEEGEFVLHIPTPSNVGGRYSALSAFGMFPASMCGMPVEQIAARAVDMAERCRSLSSQNPGLELGKFLAENASSGRDKVTIVTSPKVERLGLWLEQLLAESTGKIGRGLIPIAGEPVLPSSIYGDDRQFVVIELRGEDEVIDPDISGSPSFHISLEDKPSIGSEFFRWQFATAIAACGIGVYPFDQPDVEAAKERAREQLDLGEGCAIDTTDAESSIRGILAEVREGDYIALVVFLPESAECTNSFSELRSAISAKTGLATTFGYGPRYLHSTGQLHKGGPTSCKLIAFAQDDDEADIDVPGTGYTLGRLSLAQAAGDVQALRDAGRQAELVILEDPIATISQIANWL